MTCIVGMVYKDKVIMGADSASSNDCEQFIRSDTKLFRLGEFLIGGSGSFRMIQLLKYSLNLPDIGDKSIFPYMCTDFINAVRQCFKEGGFAHIDNGEEVGGSFLVGYKNRLFRIDCDFQVAEYIDNFMAIGSGAHVALGSLFTTLTIPFNLDEEEKIRCALLAASKMCLGVAEPFHILTT